MSFSTFYFYLFFPSIHSILPHHFWSLFVSVADLFALCALHSVEVSYFFKLFFLVSILFLTGFRSVCSAFPLAHVLFRRNQLAISLTQSHILFQTNCSFSTLSSFPIRFLYFLFCFESFPYSPFFLFYCYFPSFLCRCRLTKPFDDSYFCLSDADLVVVLTVHSFLSELLLDRILVFCLTFFH